MSGVFAKIGKKIFEARRLLSIVAFLALWEIAPRLGLIRANFLPPFSVCAMKLFEMIGTGEIIKHIAISLRRSFTGLGIGLLFSIPMGILIGTFRKLEYYIDPLLQTLRQTSVIALLPVFLLFFGIKEPSKYVIVFWGVWAPLLLNTVSGVKGVDPVLIKAAKSMGANQIVLFGKVILPSSLPFVMTGLRLATTSSILVLTAAEMMGASSGLGFILYDAQSKYLIPKMYAIILTMSIIGITLNYILVMLEKRVTRWQPKLNT
jgi:NitT/TauT family transport system permease protein